MCLIGLHWALLIRTVALQVGFVGSNHGLCRKRFSVSHKFNYQLTLGSLMMKCKTATLSMGDLYVYAQTHIVCLFACVEILRPIQPNGVMSSAVSLLSHTFTGQVKSSERLTSIVHTLSPETDKCPSWISGRERMIEENISWSISTKECCRPGGGRTRNLLVISRMHIQLSHRSR